MRELQTTGGETVAPSRKTWWFIAVFGCIAGFVIVCDVVTKLYVVESLRGEQPVKLFGGAIYLVHIRNTGAAFGLASSATVFLSVLALLVSGVILYLAFQVRTWTWSLSLGLIFGGAVGNLIDRIFRAPAPLQGGVVDFLSVFDPVEPPWPVFNLADSALVVGVILAVVLELRGVTLRGRAEEPTKEPEKEPDKR